MHKSVTGLFLLAVVSVSGQELSPEKQEAISTFIGWVKTAQKDSVAAHASFPLRREYPIPYVMDAREFVLRYDEIFDAQLTKMIAGSNTTTDWSEVGWRGIMLGNGQVWVDDDGTLTAVNYQSEFEKHRKAELIERDPSRLYQSLQQYIRPVYLLETKSYRIRIDETSPGNYRYASWKLDKPMSGKPDIVLENGELEHHGSGGNHDITFKNGKFKYVCDIIILGEDDAPPARLYFYKSAKELMVEDAAIIIK